MGGPVWKRINVVDPRAVNGLNVAGYGRPGHEKSWTVPSLLPHLHIIQQWAKHQYYVRSRKISSFLSELQLNLQKHT